MFDWTIWLAIAILLGANVLAILYNKFMIEEEEDE